MNTMQKQKKESTIATVILVTVACMLLFMLNNGVRSNFGLISSAIKHPQSERNMQPQHQELSTEPEGLAVQFLLLICKSLEILGCSSSL